MISVHSSDSDCRIFRADISQQGPGGLCSSETLDVYLVYEMSPDTVGCVAPPSSRVGVSGGPFDAYCSPSDTGDLTLISDRLPGCPYRMTSYASADIADVDPVYGLQLHHPRFLEFIGAPESARLLTQAPGHWVRTMDRENAVAVALWLQHDAGLMTSNLQVLGQFVTSLNVI